MPRPTTRTASRPTLALALALALACGGDDGGASGGTGGSSGSSGSGSSGTFGTFGTSAASAAETEGGDTDGAGPVQASNRCELAPSVGQGRWSGTLRAREENLEGACGLGGPDAFFRVEVPWRADVRVQAAGAGFEPRVGLLRGACLPRWSTHMDACVRGVPGWALDVRPDERLTVSVGADPDDPALMAGAGPGDPAAFAVDVFLRPVLAAGDPCDPVGGSGRCETGTACQGEPGQARCEVLAADTCLTADARAPTQSVDTVWIDPGAPQTDAHAHSCAGARWRERVLRIELPEDLPPSDLTLRVDRPGVALALRAPGCLAADELACAPAGPAGALLTVPDADQRAAAGEPLWLFIELAPDLQPPADPFPLTLTLTPA